MEVVGKTDNNIILEESFPPQEQQKKHLEQIASPGSAGNVNSPTQRQQQHQQQQQKTKRKHRRGKPKSKNANKPYKTFNWKFQVPRPNYNSSGGGAGIGHRNGARAKLVRSRSLVPYNTNKFLMEEHLADVPSALLTTSGRTRDSSFSVDSEDNYFFSLPEDEEEFLTKEFANVYEKARVERLDNLTKQQLIEECLSIEDRYSSDLTQRQQQLNVQRISAEFMSKIRGLEEKIKELSRENYNLRCQLMRSAALAAAAAASPPSAAAPIGAAYEPTEPTPMDSSSEDSESDSSSSSSSSSLFINDDGGGGDGHRGLARAPRRHRSCSSRSSLSEYHGYIENNYVENDDDNGILNNWRIEEQQQLPECERQQLLEEHMLDNDDDSNQNTDENKVLDKLPSKSHADGTAQAPDGSKLSPTHTSQSTNEPDDSTAAASATVSSMRN